MQSVNSEHAIRKIDFIQRSGRDRHWVGNGFPVRTLFSYSNLGSVLSPFLLLDYAGPMEFAPTNERLGVGEHPHRGFETVTIVYQGSVEHRDSSGGGGSIGPGDVQWMTAASGVVHEEFHGRDLARHGGTLEMVQLWVNLPAKEKMTAPRYQALLKEQIPSVDLPDGAGTARIIAGEFRRVKGPAKTFTPLHLWDLHLTSDRRIDLAVPVGYTTALVVLKGRLRLNGSETVSEAEVAVLDRAGGRIYIDDAHAVTTLLLSGEPINEPIVGRGPFVMNTTQEIQQAMLDYQSGRMGQLA
jgi:quercetin 2,3-dioxygenase